jgi:hypothetical protein
MYEPGTKQERAYMRGLLSIFQADSRVDSATAVTAILGGGVIEEVEISN